MDLSAMTVETSVFGTIALGPDDACAMDGGTHGCVGHTLSVTRDGVARWERRLDSMGDPDDCAGAGTRRLDETDWALWSDLIDRVWASSRSAETPEEPRMDVPHYVWAVAIRRGEEVRLWEGPPFGDPFREPGDGPGELLDWMRERVAVWCGFADS